jgi:hypothetical protein
MGLTSDLRDIVSDIFAEALDDIPVDVTYIVKAQAYDPSTGSVTPAETEYAISAVKTKFEDFQINNVSVFDTDQRLLIAAKDLSPTPRQNDLVEIDGVKWRVEAVRSDPVHAHWDVQIRRP